MKRTTFVRITTCLLALTYLLSASAGDFDDGLQKPNPVVSELDEASGVWGQLRELDLSEDIKEELGLTVLSGDLAGKNCAVHELNLPGQKFRAGGSEGGLHSGPLPTTAGYYPASFDYINSIEPVSYFLNAFNENVAIIVLDLFSEQPPDQNQVSNWIPHGELVLEHFDSLIDATEIDTIKPFEGGATSTLNGFEVMQYNHISSNNHLLLIKADIANASDPSPSSDIAAVLGNAIGAVQNEGYENIVVNMSFVLIPCETLEAFNASYFPTFETYVYALARAMDSSAPMDADGIMAVKECSWTGINCNGQDLSDSDPETFLSSHYDLLSQLLFKYPDDALVGQVEELSNTATFVASSGNFSLNYEMYPAANSRVISVGAYVGAPDFSNAGDIIEVGAWYQRLGTDTYYAGTSFSAPVVSLYIALGMGSDDLCSQINGGQPKLTEGRDKKKLSLTEIYTGSSGCTVPYP